MIMTIGTTPAVARSMTFERLAVGDVNRAAAVDVRAAGKAVNAARVIATLGEPVRSVGFAGGASGDELLADMRRAGIDPRYVIAQAATRVCVTVIDAATAAATELIEEAARVEHDEYVAFLRAVAEAGVGCDVIVCSGSLAPGVADDTYARCAQIFRHSLPLVIVDAKGEALRQAAGGPRVVLKCNRAEFAETFGDGDITAVVRQLNAGEPDAADDRHLRAVITDGPRPTLVVDRGGAWLIETPRVPVVSPIGSGDSVAGGLAVGLSRNMTFQDAARLGVACGAANAMTAVAGGVDLGQVERLFNEIVALPL
jgi:tagatose 6-phosphate kinase